MNLDNLNKWLIFAANLGVIAGIAFLAIEIRQNSEVLQAEASFAQLTVESGRRATLYENVNGMAELVLKQTSSQELSGVENYRLNLFWLDFLSYWQWKHREYLAGRLDRNSLDLRAWRAQWRVYPGLQRQYEETKSGMDESFIDFIETEIAPN
jgi:hypothetical protein